jgi:DNA-binding Xre family transcriptional regulator
MNPDTENPTTEADRYVVLNIRALMADRNVRSVAALQRMLITAGVDISNQQLNRIVDNRATLLNLTVVNGLMKVLQCSVHELFGEITVPKHTKKINLG